MRFEENVLFKVENFSLYCISHSAAILNFVDVVCTSLLKSIMLYILARRDTDLDSCHYLHQIIVISFIILTANFFLFDMDCFIIKVYPVKYQNNWDVEMSSNSFWSWLLVVKFNKFVCWLLLGTYSTYVMSQCLCTNGIWTSIPHLGLLFRHCNILLFTHFID